MKRWPLAGLMAAALSFASAANPAAKSITGDCVVEPGVSVWSLPVRVMTEKFLAIGGLRATDFSLTDKRIPQEICGFSHERQPSSIGILLDTSASMGAGFDGVAMAQAAVNQLLATSGPEDEFFLEYVKENPEMQCAFTRDLGQIRSALNTHAKGQTALIDAVYMALDAMRKARFSNRALVVISDADDTASIYELRDLSSAYSELPAPVFLLIPRTPTERSRRQPLYSGGPVPFVNLNPFDQNGMVRFASRSGGGVVNVSSEQQMISAAKQVGIAIRSPYVLSFRRTPQRAAGEPFDLKVQVNGLRPRPMALYRSIVRYAH